MDTAFIRLPQTYTIDADWVSAELNRALCREVQWTWEVLQASVCVSGPEIFEGL